MSDPPQASVVVAGPGAAFPRPVLAQMDFELTERCDNDCRHCCVNLPLDDAAALAAEVTTLRAEEILAEAAELGLLRVRFTGGEPLVRDDFEELYEYTRRLGITVTLATNARRVTPRLAALFSEIPPRSPAEVTVYGMSASTYDAMTRRRGSFAEFRRGVGLLVEAGVPLKLSGAFRPPYVAEMKELIAWAAELPTVVDTPSQVMFYDLRRRRDSDRRARGIEGVRADPAEVLSAAAEAVGHEAVSAGFCRAFCGPSGDGLFACDIGKRPAVDPYGVLHACSVLRDPRLAYDLSTGSLRHAVTEVFPALKELRATDPAYLERCARCFLAGYCEQCPARAFAEHGVLDRPVEYQCAVAQAQARRLGLLGDGEHPWEVTDWKERIACLKE